MNCQQHRAAAAQSRQSHNKADAIRLALTAHRLVDSAGLNREQALAAPITAAGGGVKTCRTPIVECLKRPDALTPWQVRLMASGVLEGHQA